MVMRFFLIAHIFLFAFLADAYHGPGEQVREMLRGGSMQMCLSTEQLGRVGFCSAGFLRPEAPDKTVAVGSEPLGLYQRKTQSRIIWCRITLATVTFLSRHSTRG